MNNSNFKIISPKEKDSDSKRCTASTDWTKCLICQKDNEADILQTSTNIARYYNIIENLTEFKNLGCLPFDIKRLVNESIDEDGSHSYAIHKLCALEYSTSRLERARKRKLKPADDAECSTKYTRKSDSHRQCLDRVYTCFICDKPGTLNDLHEVQTFSCDQSFRDLAAKTQHKSLLAKLSAGDLIAQEAKYHKLCKLKLLDQARELSKVTDSETLASYVNHGIALAEVVAYIEDCRADEETTPVFRLSDLRKMYTQRIIDLGCTKYVHVSRLKERIMAHFPDMQAHKEGRDILLVFAGDVGAAIKLVCQSSCDADGYNLVCAAKMVRQQILQDKPETFNGTFPEGVQQDSVPNTLVSLISMILDGPSNTSQAKPVSQAALTIAQLIVFNSHVRRRKDSVSMHHSKEKETPLPEYIGLMVHALTRSRTLIDKLYELGLSISYDRVLEISSSMGNTVCEYYSENHVVCPPKLRGNLFTTAAVDNLDHNPSSATSKHSFHGTSLSMFQHPSKDEPGIERGINLHQTESKSISPLPEFYTNVPPVILPQKSPPIPGTGGPSTAEMMCEPTVPEEEKG